MNNLDCRYFPDKDGDRNNPDCETCTCNWHRRVVNLLPICLDCTQESCRRAWAINANGLKGTCSGFVSRRSLEMRNAGLLDERGRIVND